MNSKYQFNEVINTYDTTPDGNMSPITALQLFQEAAQRHTDSLDIGLDFLNKKHLAWILVKYEIEFHEYPKGETKVIVETQATGFNRFEASRRFRILSEDGRELVTGKSIWMLIDTITKKLVRVSNVEELMILLDDEPYNFKIPRLRNLEDHNGEKSFEVRYLDIDINHHVNNTKYLA